MSGVWGSDDERAWWGFANDVRSALEDDGYGIVEVEVVTAGAESDGCRPWVTVGDEDGAYSAGVSGNDLLASEHRLDAEQEEQLVEMGFREEVRGADGQRWYGREAGPDDLDLLVALVVRALREVFGVVHPAFVEWDGQTPAPAGVDAPTYPARPRPDACVAWPDSPAELAALVDDVVGGWLGHEPVKDDDGDIPIVRGESMLFVRVSSRTARVDLFSILVRDVRHRRAARREVNLLNRKSRGQTYWVSDDRVMMRRCLAAEPFVPLQLTAVLEETLRGLDDIAHDLAERVGGLRFLADDSEQAL